MGMKKLSLSLLVTILAITSLVFPTTSSATFDDSEAVELESQFETPYIIKDTYLDENGTLVTEYEYPDTVTYDANGNVLSTNNDGIDRPLTLPESGEMQAMSACAPIISSRLISETLVETNKKLGWHPDFPKEGNKNVSYFWFQNATKSVSFGLGVNYGAASISVSISKGGGSGHSIKNPSPSYWMRPAVIADVHKRVTEFNQKASCGLPAKTWRTTNYVPKKVWYRADRVS
jgi:hypothetical protein